MVFNFDVRAIELHYSTISATLCIKGLTRHVTITVHTTDLRPPCEFAVRIEGPLIQHKIYWTRLDFLGFVYLPLVYFFSIKMESKKCTLFDCLLFTEWKKNEKGVVLTALDTTSLLPTESSIRPSTWQHIFFNRWRFVFNNNFAFIVYFKYNQIQAVNLHKLLAPFKFFTTGRLLLACVYSAGKLRHHSSASVLGKQWSEWREIGKVMFWYPL